MKISRRALLTIRKSEKILKFGAEFCDAIKILVGKHITPLNAVHATCDGAVKLINLMSKVNVTSFNRDDLRFIRDGLKPFFSSFILKHQGIILNANELCQVTKHYVEKDLVFYCHFYNSAKEPAYISYEKNQEEKVIQYLATEFWKKINNAAILKVFIGNNGYDKYLSYDPMDLGSGYYHDEFDELKAYIELFMSHNINRSILLYGCPGTGKTTLCKLLAKNLNLKTLMIPTCQLNDTGLADILMLIDIIKPDMIIIDEFDKSTYKAAIFNTLEELNKRCKLVIATANDIEYLKSEPGLIRPGRFDKTIKINKIDIRVLSDILGPYSDEFLNTIKNWPPAFVQEVRNIIDALGVEQAKLEIPKLRKRVNENKQKKTNTKNIVDKSDEKEEQVVFVSK